MFRCLVLVLVVLFASWPASAESRQEKKPPAKKKASAEVRKPSDKGKVAMLQDVEGVVSVKGGWPVVLVQPLVGERQWWIQKQVTTIDAKSGAFSTECYFGDDDTKAGTQFRVIIIMAKTKGDAKKFKKGEAMDDLPEDLPRSTIITVTRE